MIICTYATQSAGYYPVLVKQCEKLKLKLVTIGMNKKWEGTSQKYTDMNEYIKSLPDNEILLFTDGYDSIPVCNEETILKKYNKVKANKHIVYCVEFRKNMTYFSHIFTFGKCNDKFINSGTYIGRVKELKILFNNFIKHIKNKKLSDQVALTKFCNTNNKFFTDLVNLDINNELFYNVEYNNSFNYIFSNENNLNIKIKNNKIITNNNSNPCIYLGSGGVDLDILLTHLGYNFNNERLDNYKSYLLKAFPRQILSFSLIVITLIVILCISVKKIYKFKY